MSGRKVFTAKKAALFLIALFISACGSNADVYVSAESNTGSKRLTLHVRNSLTDMETEIFQTFSFSNNCDYDASPYSEDVQRIIEDINLNLPNLPDFEPPVNAVFLQSGPPRWSGTVAVHLCEELEAGAFTLFRSVFLSNAFLENLYSGALAWGDDELFEPALAYILFHEVGHAVMNHSADKIPPVEEEENAPLGEHHHFDLPQEIEADSFAYDLMVLTDRNLLGMVMAHSLDSL